MSTTTTTTTANTNTQSLPATLEFSRTITTADSDGSQVPAYPTASASSVRVGAICNTANCTLGLHVYLLGSSGQVISTAVVSFMTQASPDFGGMYSAVETASVDPCWPLGGSKSVAVKVDSISGGTWTINGAMQ
jgi:hypothetical protein